MTSPPRVDIVGSEPVVVLQYTDGDTCGSSKYHTTVTLMCDKKEVYIKYSHLSLTLYQP